MKNVNLKTGMAGLFLLITLAFTSCKKDTTTPTPTPGPTNAVTIQSMSFNPSIITVPVGTRITWTNKDNVPHTVTSDVNLFDSGNMATNGTYSYTFNTAGTYPYHCKIHSGMNASVVVQ